MDYEYLQNIMGSPHVDEGAFSRLKSKAAQGLQNFRSMAGQGIEDPRATKIKSLWVGIYQSLIGIMTDWSEQGKPNITSRARGVKISREIDHIINVLDDLTDAVQNPDASKIGGNIHTAQGMPTQSDTRQRADAGPTSRQQTLSKTKQPHMAAQKKDYPLTFKEMANESYWDAAKRQLTGGGGINKSMRSQDPGSIANAYKNRIKKLYDDFINDAMKVTRQSREAVIGLIQTLSPKPQVNPNTGSKGYVPSGSMGNIVDKLENLSNTPDAPVQGQPPTPTATPATTPPATTPPATTPPATTPEPPSEEPSATEPTTPGEAPPAYAGPSQGAEATYDIKDIDPRDLPYIVERAMAIIIDAVKKDVSHSGHFFDPKKQIPTSWHDPQITKEAEEPPTTEPEDLDDPETGVEEAPEIEGEFVYNFHSNWRKKHEFSIQVKPLDSKLNEPLYLPYSKTWKDIDVWWKNKDTENEIYVVMTDRNTGKVSQAFLMAFADYEVSPEMGAMTAGNENEFDVERALDTANEPEDEGGWLGKADTKTASNIASMKENFIRSLYATTIRKSMEWKAKKKGSKSITFDDKTGEVTLINPDPKKGEKAVYTMKEIEGLLQTSPEWYNTLDHYGYFKAFPAMKKASNTAQYQEAVDKLVGSGEFGLKEAERLAKKAFVALRQSKGLSAAISTDEIINAVKAAKGGNTWTWDKDGNVKTAGGVIPIPKSKVKDLDDTAKKELADAGYWKQFPDVPGNPAAAPEPPKAPTTSTVPTKESGWTISGWNNDGSLNIKTKEGDKLLNKMHVKRLDEPTRKHLESMGYWDQFPDVEGKPSGVAGGPPPSAPVSAPPSAPSPSTPPSAPVSKPLAPQSPEKKAAKKGATQPIEIWKDPNQDPKDNLMWKNKKGKIGGLNPEKAKEFMSDAEFAKAWKAAEAGGFKPPKDYENLEESFVNPFQLANLL